MVVPYSLRCGGFQDNLVDVVMWFSSGNTSSVLHYDSMDNINCVLDGKKKMVLIDKVSLTDCKVTGLCFCIALLSTFRTRVCVQCT